LAPVRPGRGIGRGTGGGVISYGRWTTSIQRPSAVKQHELSHERGDQLGPDPRVTILDLKIPAHDIAALAQSLQPFLHHHGTLGDRENSDAMNWLLSPGLRRK
jgi:hypothetical protein